MVEGVQNYGHIFKVALGHQALHNTGNVFSRNGYLLSLLQADQLQDLVLVKVTVSLHTHTTHLVFPRMVIIYFDATPHFLRLQEHSPQEQQRSAKYPSQMHSNQNLTCKYSDFI